MTKLEPQWIRCPICGNKTRYYFDEDDYILNEYRIFATIPCFKCKPQKSIDDFLPKREKTLIDLGFVNPTDSLRR